MSVAGEPDLHAWVDESMRVSGVAEPMYLMAAVIADPQECDPIREQLRTLGVPRYETALA